MILTFLKSQELGIQNRNNLSSLFLSLHSIDPRTAGDDAAAASDEAVRL